MFNKEAVVARSVGKLVFKIFWDHLRFVGFVEEGEGTEL